MNKNIFLVFYLVVITMLMGCAGRNLITQDINRQHCSLVYLHDSEQQTTKKDIKIKVEDITIVKGLPDSASVVKTRVVVIPALIVYVWDKNYLCNIGKKSIQENVPDFIQDSFIEEAQR